VVVAVVVVVAVIMIVLVAMVVPVTMVVPVIVAVAVVVTMVSRRTGDRVKFLVQYVVGKLERHLVEHCKRPHRHAELRGNVFDPCGQHALSE
jgi:hypothetical protein